MKNNLPQLRTLLILLAFAQPAAFAQNNAVTKPSLDSILPVRGFCIAAPNAKDLERFIKFINEELAPRKVNTLILRVDYNYAYESHPELRDNSTLSRPDIKKLVSVCKENNIRLIPQINLLEHFKGIM